MKTSVVVVSKINFKWPVLNPALQTTTIKAITNTKRIRIDEQGFVSHEIVFNYT